MMNSDRKDTRTAAERARTTASIVGSLIHEGYVVTPEAEAIHAQVERGELTTEAAIAILRWEQIDFKAGLVHVARVKNGTPSTHPIRGPELRALRELKRAYPDSPYLFVTERGGPMTPATVRKLVTRAGELARLPFPIHPHMLRHSAGYKLASDGQDTRAIQQYLGHKNITHTVRYTALSPERFKNFWKD